MSVTNDLGSGYTPAAVVVAAVKAGQARSSILSDWYAAVAIEPRLFDLEERVRSMVVDGDHPDFWRRYSQWKSELCQLVGWDCVKRELQTSRMFESCLDFLMSVFEGRA